MSDFKTLSHYLSMRTYIFLAMVLAVVAPMAIMLNNRESKAFERELVKVEQAHLIIAMNLASSLQRFATDAGNAFDFIVTGSHNRIDPDRAQQLLSPYGIYAMAKVDVQSSPLQTVFGDSGSFPPVGELLSTIDETPYSKSSFSAVHIVDAQPTMFLLHRSADGALYIGAMATTYIQEQQQSITFGELGHAMIVDHTGRVLGHPKAEWTNIAKDASALDVVQKMLARGQGVTQFYSPPLDADMISGYTFVPATGWGVMVPQPIEELHAAARVESHELLQTLLAIFVIALFVSWLLSGIIVRPLKQISRTVEQVQSGDPTARVPEFSRSAPDELKSLRQLLNDVMDNWQENLSLLERSLKASNEATEHKAQAISILSHEMRTPLNGVVGAADLLVNTDLNEKQLKYSKIIKTSAITLLDHVNNVLEVSTLESGRRKASSSPIDVRQLLQDIINENQTQADNTGIALTMHVDKNVPEQIVSDQKLLRNIAANLVSNAVKFTSSGQVDVTLEKSGLRNLTLSVKDSGTGIGPGDISRIFEPFAVIDSSFNRRQCGTGLGLSIVKLSVDAIGGSIDAQSTQDVGSTFKVQIPFEHASLDHSEDRSRTPLMA